jgi:hypothetical protein
MALDGYSLCPGGTGKKIKFCCGDFLDELQKIERMIEGEQYLACLQHIERLLGEKRGQDRACLLAPQCALLRATHQIQAAEKAAAYFLAKHPDNQIALAESAILASETNPHGALDFLQRAMRASGGEISGRVYQAMGIVAQAMIHTNFPLSARALLQLQFDIARSDEQPRRMLSAIAHAPDIPLLLRSEPFLQPCPEDVAWKDRFHEAMQATSLGNWRKAADLLTGLAADAPDSPILWRNLAATRGWLAENDGAIEAWRKYAALRAREPNGLEDAVEAEALAMFLSADPLGDRMESFNLVWTIKDAERLQEALLSSLRIQSVPFDPARFSDGQSPPPKGAYLLLDRPMPASAEGLSPETVPSMIGQALLYGKQTDREGRLEVLNVAADDLQAVQKLIGEAAGEFVELNPLQEAVGRWSASQRMLQNRWIPPRDVEPEQMRAMVERHIHDVILNRWPDWKLGVLDGISARESAGVVQVSSLFHGDQTQGVRVLAAILVLEFWTERVLGPFDFNELRTKLGLPVPGPIKPGETSLEDLPNTRLSRLETEGLSDKDLITAFYRAGAFAIRSAQRKFAEAIVARPSFADSDHLLHAYATLAHTEEDIDKALDSVERGRRAAEAKKQSSASWDLTELSLRFGQRDGEKAMSLIDHIQTKHIEEPGVGEALTRMLMDVGLLRPDGTPAVAPQESEPAMAEEAAEPGGLWTPDSAKPAAGGGKLWMPE